MQKTEPNRLMNEVILLQSWPGGAVLPEWDSFLALLFKLLLDLIVVWGVVLKIYRPSPGDRSYQFTFLVFNLLIFFLCHLMVRVELGLGFAFGLFALFSIMRYRTMTIHIREMTYLFVVISLGVINSIYGTELSVFEILLINGVIAGLVFLADRALLATDHVSMVLTYDRIDQIGPDYRPALIEDLQSRTGLAIDAVEILSVNFLNDTAEVKIYFREEGRVKKE
ncbi:MAG: DUF4956 domain-containing protein [Bacteroidota bacterium]